MAFIRVLILGNILNLGDYHDASKIDWILLSAARNPEKFASLPEFHRFCVDTTGYCPFSLFNFAIEEELYDI